MLSPSGKNGKYAKQALGKLAGEIGRESPRKVEDTRIAGRGTTSAMRLPKVKCLNAISYYASLMSDSCKTAFFERAKQKIKQFHALFSL